MKLTAPLTSIGLVVIAVSLLPFPDSFRATVIVVGGIVVTFLGWRNSLRERFLVGGTPTSKIASAAKGFAELKGRARNALTTPLYDPILNKACVWFLVETEKFDFAKFRWRTAGTARSSRAFALQDDTGLCLVLPNDADLLTDNAAEIVRERIALRHTIKRIRDGQSLYAIGHLERIAAQDAAPVRVKIAAPRVDVAPAGPEFERRVSALMSVWKRDPRQRRARFDPNGDGKVDEQEMTAAREAARFEVGRGRDRAAPSTASSATPSAPQTQSSSAGAATTLEQYAVDGQPVTHWLRKPDADRPYIVTTLSEEQLIAREGRAARVYLAVFILLAFGALTFLTHKIAG